ncbi:Rne/Rng family ribonuclease [Clostridium sp. MD294]|uniref:Rne/Rng family ribonuclease n=1 Tax=Clostridium sp. MD294 TaxID=97138 RepID=UPI0002CB4CE8|nr:Rne/Rng family ribonuclease [Clostridium sp. MD294]NDO46849.1 Rne/Rng family ribonuclease [Clostridium sp. MD294]USF28708.1 Ribonuclease G [Clostridium sp. MD294]
MNRILVDCSAHQINIGVVEQGQLVEYFVENKQNKSIVGNIYAARVEAVLSGMQSAFVNIGEQKNAYYYYGNNRAETDKPEQKSKKPKVGDTVIVQVQKDAVAKKGAVVTDHISLAGKFVVLLPDEAGEIGISKKIEQKQQKIRIEKCIKNILPDNYSVIVRTNGETKTESEFQLEIDMLVKRAEKIKQQGQYVKPPALLYEYGNVVLKQLRDIYTANIDEIVVNDKNIFNEISKEYNNVVLSEKKSSLFAQYYVQKQSQKALEKKVWLKSGGFIIIEQTEACVVIDVNTGKYTGKKNLEKTILKTNLEAAEEIAKQLRLRNLSGIIIVDFIDMTEQQYKETVIKAVKQAVKKDTMKTAVVGMTELGLLQMTRKKARPSLQQTMMVKCKCCDGIGQVPSLYTVVAQIRQEVVALFENTIYKSVVVEANKTVLNTFCGEKQIFQKELEKEFNKKIICVENENMMFGMFDVRKCENIDLINQNMKE